MARWWERPSIWPDEETVGERKVGFLDLFYDLIFVVAIAQVAHGLAHHMDRSGIVTFLMLALPVFWAWVGHTFYVDRFENRDLSHVLYTFASMLPVVGMAVFAHQGLDDGSRGFIFSFVAARAILVFMWVRAAVHNAQGRDVWVRLALGFAVGAFLWFLSAFYSGHTRLGLQIAGLVWDFAIPSMAGKRMARLPRFAEGRLRERFGLIMIIVLGESVAGTVNGLADVHHFEWRHGVTAFLAMFFAFGVYFTYFEMVPRERLRARLHFGFLRTYLHLPLLLSVTAAGAGVLATVGHEDEVLGQHVRWVLGLGIGLAYLSMVGLSRCHEYASMGAGRTKTEGALVAGFVVAAAVAFLAEGWTSTEVLGAIAASSALPWLMGVYHWRKFTKHQPKKAEVPTGG